MIPWNCWLTSLQLPFSGANPLPPIGDVEGDGRPRLDMFKVLLEALDD